ncbi:MAG: glycosyltransferase family 2 protein [Anaerolineae bacterium]|nr:glycosyltransferase family 2 protein [Anaerolineae bacterium]
MAQPLSPNIDVPATVTVVICTHNRCEYLTETLDALNAQHCPDFSFTVLVVDNGSTDDTRQRVTDFQTRLRVPLDYVYEARLGLSIARNVAIDRVTTPYIAFLDDDSPPSPRWLVHLLAPFTSLEPRPGAVGGRVLLRWSDQQPAWLPDELLGVYSQLDYGETPQIVRMVNGCNVAFPTEVLRHYRFDTRLGVVGKGQLPGEDAEILQRMRADKLSVYYQPAALVTHIVGRYRENPDYIWQRCHGIGRQQALLAVLPRWPGRRGIMRLMLQDCWFRRHWWKRLLVGTLSGKLLRDVQERTWARSALIRFYEFQRQMAVFFLGGSASLPSQ